MPCCRCFGSPNATLSCNFVDGWAAHFTRQQTSALLFLCQCSCRLHHAFLLMLAGSTAALPVIRAAGLHVVWARANLRALCES